MKKSKKKIRTIKGIIVSDRMQKTVVVAVKRLKTHPLYNKKIKMTKRYKAHDDKNKFKTGDKVLIAETRPLSKNKRWRVIKKI